jgi:hypothetical protein
MAGGAEAGGAEAKTTACVGGSGNDKSKADAAEGASSLAAAAVAALRLLAAPGRATR